MGKRDELKGPILAGALLAVTTLGCEPPPGDRWLDRVAPTGLYAEFLEYDELEGRVAELFDHDASLTVAVPTERIGDPELASLLRAARRSRVDLRLWPLLPTAEGYWPNEANLRLFAGEVERLLDWLEAEGLGAGAIVYDMEPAYDYALAIRELDPFDSQAVDALFGSHIDPDAHQRAKGLLQESVALVQARGLRAVCVTFPQVLDDQLDGDADLQDALDVPIDGVGFDEVGFMVYQTTFGETLGSWIGPSLVESYAEDAVEQFGGRAVIALGTIGTVGIFGHELGYGDPSLLAVDIERARAAGVRRVELYSLDGMLEGGGVAAWLEAAPPMEPESVPDSPASTVLVRSFVQGIDGRLDGLR